MPKLLRLVLTGAALGALLGFLVGLLLLGRNPIGAAADRAVLLAVATMLYALVVAVPAALGLAVFERLRPAGLARLRALVPKPRILAAFAAVLFAAAVGLTAPDVPRTSGRAAELGFQAVTTVVAEPPDRKVALLGFDGVDPALLTALAGRGEMPRFQELIAAGALSRLATLDHGLSPPIWTSFATGVDPTVHAIHDFVVRRLRPTRLDLAAVRRYPRGFGAATLFSLLAKSPLVEETLITPRDRRAPPIWSLATLAGLPTCVVDWMGSWPSEPVGGTSVSDRAFVAWNLGALSLSTGETGDGKVPLRLQKHGEEAEGGELPALCHPEPLCRSYFPAPTTGASSVHPSVDPAQFHLAENRFYLSTAERLLPAAECRFFAFYSHLPDFVNHHVGPKELEAAFAGSYETKNGRDLLEAYREVDRTLGALLDLLGPDTSVVIVSDHGVEIVGEGARRRVSHAHGPDGVFLFRPSNRASGSYRAPAEVTLYDVAPTVLALAGLPLAASMPGHQVEPVVTSELGALERRAIDADRLAAASADAAETMTIDPQVEAELKERLRSLGYIE